MWAVSRRVDEEDANKIDDFWEASRGAAAPATGPSEGSCAKGPQALAL
jgi:hypothetical protein